MSSPESGSTRREFLRNAGKIAVAGAAVVVGGAGLGLIVKNEVSKGKDGIVRVDEGNFIPLYERHDLGISPENFPQDIDALFEETGEKLMDMQVLLGDHPQTLINSLNQGSRTNANEAISNLSKRNAPLVFGDILPSPSQHVELYDIGISAAEFLIGLAAWTSRGIARRKFLKLALGSVGLFGLSNITVVIPILTNQIENPEWITRVNRINGITSHMHPEQPLTFLRNAIMADKLLLTGKSI